MIATVVGVPLDVESFENDIGGLAEIAKARSFLQKHLAPVGVQKSPGTIITLEIFNRVIVVQEVDVGILSSVIDYIASDVATYAAQIDRLISIRDIKRGHRWSNRERRRFIGNLGVRTTGPWLKPTRTRSSRLMASFELWKLGVINARRDRLIRRNPSWKP